MDEISTLDAISSTLSQSVAQGLDFVKGQRMLALQLDGGIAQCLLSEFVEHLADIPASLGEQPNLVDMGFARGVLNSDCQRTFIATRQRAHQRTVQ